MRFKKLGIGKLRFIKLGIEKREIIVLNGLEGGKAGKRSSRFVLHVLKKDKRIRFDYRQY